MVLLQPHSTHTNSWHPARGMWDSGTEGMGEANNPQAAISYQERLKPFPLGQEPGVSRATGGRQRGAPALFLRGCFSRAVGPPPAGTSSLGTAPTPTAHTYFIW